ncbi:hypothetical protein [Bacillus sp. HMF5848]|nr:hypothetical protein [Bacillus sp. HMF5848]
MKPTKNKDIEIASLKGAKEDSIHISDDSIGYDLRFSKNTGKKQHNK